MKSIIVRNLVLWDNLLLYSVLSINTLKNINFQIFFQNQCLTYGKFYQVYVNKWTCFNYPILIKTCVRQTSISLLSHGISHLSLALMI